MYYNTSKLQLTKQWQEKNKMNIYVAVGIIGIIGNFLAALADVPLVKPGKQDKDQLIAGTGGISSWWADVNSKRFIVSSWRSN